MSHLDLIQNEFLRVAKESDKKTWNQFFSTMGQVEVSNPDPRAKKPKIKITSLRGSTPDTPKGKLLQQLYKKWKGSGGAEAVKSHAKSTLDRKETTTLRQKLKEREKELKSQRSETEKLKKKLEQRKETVQQKDQSQKNIKKEEVVDDDFDKKQKQKIDALDVSGVRDDSSYQDTIGQIRKNESKVPNDISFLKDPPPPSQNSLDEVKSSADAISRAMNGVGLQGANISSVKNAPNTLTYKIKFDNDQNKIRGSRWLRGNDAKNIISSLVGKDRDVIISEDRKSGTVDVEVPKDNRDIVSLKELLTDDNYLKRARKPGKLVFPVGKTSEGEVKTFDFTDDSPHMLVAGGTGSGKSVFINSMVNSMMATYKPSDVQFVMIDVAKRGNEFGQYNGSKYLARPVATTEHDAIKTLKSVQKEGRNRFKRLQDLSAKSGVTFKDVEAFNKFISKNPKEMNDEERTAYNNIPENERQKIPRLVVVADEVKDLLNPEINKNAKSIKGNIDSILAVARQAGIQMVLATQSPALKAIPRQLQANLGAKMIFKLNTKNDADAIDARDATDLLNHGDGYLITPEGKDRVQTPFVSGDESKQFIEHSQGTPNYLPDAGPQVSETETESEQPKEKEKTVSEPSEDLGVSLDNSFKTNIGNLRKRLDLQRSKIEKALSEATQREQDIQQRLKETQKRKDEQEESEKVNEQLESQRQTEVSPESSEPEIVTEKIVQPKTEPELESEPNEQIPVTPSGEEEQSDDEWKNVQSEIDELTKPVSSSEVQQTLKPKKDDLLNRLRKLFKSKKK